MDTDRSDDASDSPLPRKPRRRLRRPVPREDGRIPCQLVPQADDLGRIIKMVADIAGGRNDRARSDDISKRQHDYYLAACRILGFIDDDEIATPAGRALIVLLHDERIMRMAHAFEASAAGQAWLEWSKCKTLEQLRPETAQRFLDERVYFPKQDATTKPRRVHTLSKWCQEFTRVRQQHDGLFKEEARPVTRADNLPPVVLDRGGARRMIEAYASQASKTAVITAYFSVEGYLVLAQSLRYVDLRLLIGANEQGRADLDEIKQMFERSLNQLMAQDHPDKRRAIRELYRSLVRGKIKPRFLEARELHGLHAKVYIFDRYAALSGSANLTGGGMNRNIENMAVTTDPHVVATLLERFEHYYERAHVLAEPFIAAIEKSWAFQEGTPYQVFLKILQALYGPPAAPIPGESPRLAAFQEPIVDLVCARLQELRGVLLVAPTGVGKTVMAAHVATGLTRGFSGPVSRIVVVCKNRSMYQKWSNMFDRVGLAIRDVKVWELQRKESDTLPPSHEEKLRDMLAGIRATDLVIVDECQHFRNALAQGSKSLRELLRIDDVMAARPYCLLLTATPYSKGYEDIDALLGLISNDPTQRISNLEDVARSRSVVNVTMDFILTHFGKPLKGPGHRELSFGGEMRCFPVLDVTTQRYETRMEHALERIRDLDLRFRHVEQAFWSDWEEAADEVDAQTLEYAAPFLRTVLARRVESSPRAFAATIASIQEKLAAGALVPVDDRLADQLAELAALAGGGAHEDTKLASLRDIVRSHSPSHKILVFTEYKDTAWYLTTMLSQAFKQRRVRCLTGDVSQRERERILRGFAPNAQGVREPEPERNIQILVATDTVGESEDLQDARSIINYDLPWTPLKLIQRIGRLDRATTERRVVRVWNFFPGAEIYEALLGHWRRLEDRDQENAELTGASVIGERQRAGDGAQTPDARNWSGELLDRMQEPGAIRALQRQASPRTSWVLDELVGAPLESQEQARLLPNGVLTCKAGSRPGWYVLFRLGKRNFALFRDERTDERISAPDSSPHDVLLRHIAAGPQTPKLPVPEAMAEDVSQMLRTWAKATDHSPDDIETIAAVRIVSL